MATIQLPGSNHTIPADAISVVPVDLGTVIQATICVRHSAHNGMTMEQYADSVVAGRNPPLSWQDAKEMFGAAPADLAAVADFAASYGITVTGTYRSSATVELTGTVEQFNTAFGIALQTVTIPNHVYMTYNGSLSIPDTLSGVITYVNGLEQSDYIIDIPVVPSVLNSDPSAAFVPTPGAGYFSSPQAMSNAYKFPGQNNGNDGEGQVVAIILPFGNFSGPGGAGCGYNTQNLTSTFNQYGLPIPNIIPVTLNGTTNNPRGPVSVECMLDIAMVGGIVPKATIVVYFCTSYVTALNAILYDTQNTGYRPKIVSISAASFEATIPESSYQSQVDTLLTICAFQGVTVCVSSGDWGPNNGPKGFSQFIGPGACWPSSNPYVLSVGGTSLLVNPNGSWKSEVAWNNQSDYYITGGNFSIRYRVPDWQDGLTYKTNPGNAVVTLTEGTLNSTQGRMTPDVALNADPDCGAFYFFSDQNGFNTINATSGTSAAAPMWAGLIARVNQINGDTAGVVNSSYYANPSGFRDITVGNNYNKDTPSVTAFNATVGWDATTGLGSYMGSDPIPPGPVEVYIGGGISFGPGITFS